MNYVRTEATDAQIEEVRGHVFAAIQHLTMATYVQIDSETAVMSPYSLDACQKMIRKLEGWYDVRFGDCVEGTPRDHRTIWTRPAESR